MEANNSNLNGKMLNPLIDFGFIVDTDVGLIRFIRNGFQDDRAFKLDILNKSDRDILSLLYSRKNWNPLSVISTEENLEDIDDLYKSFFSNYKKEIIKNSIADKKIMGFVSSIIGTGYNIGVHSHIAVEDELEQEEVFSHFGNASIVNKSEPTSILTKDPLYVKDYKFFEDTNLIDNISRHKIYTSPRQYNIDYLNEANNALTNDNILVMMGQDYREQKGET